MRQRRRTGTEMVTDGAFGIVRNPIFSAMVVTAVGLTAMVPNVVSLIGVLALVVALELQVDSSKSPASPPSTATPTSSTASGSVASSPGRPAPRYS